MKNWQPDDVILLAVVVGVVVIVSIYLLMGGR